jgi:dTDP-4-amino-4,6-dideoxygalactose transaminase
MTGKETTYIKDAVRFSKISGNGQFTQKCQRFFEERYGFKKCLLTTSCTDALEMAAILCNVAPGDEVIVPSYTFVSTALSFIRQGAKIVFADSRGDHPNVDADRLEELITEKTKVIVPVHYAGMACEMDKIMELARKYDLLVVEDAAQAIDSYYISPATGEKRPLGSIGHLGTFSFHETKNIISGEGGMLTMNDERFIYRSEIIWEKGTNRAEFFRGEVNKYGWVDIGSSFLPSEIIAAFLWAQIENIDQIQHRRKQLWNTYYERLKFMDKNDLYLPTISSYATNNAHMFYLVCRSAEERSALLTHLKENGILAVFHYLSLHLSRFFEGKHDGRKLTNSDMFSDCLLRLPMFYELGENDIRKVVESIKSFYDGRKSSF